MNLATKAALYNVILFPGWGQVYLKRYKKGIAIIIAVIAGALSVLWSIVQTTTAFLKIYPLRKGAVTFDAVLKVAIKSIKDTNRSYLILILSLIILLWILSIVDAYNLGKKQQSVVPEVETGTTTDIDPESTSPDN